MVQTMLRKISHRMTAAKKKFRLLRKVNKKARRIKLTAKKMMKYNHLLPQQ